MKKQLVLLLTVVGTFIAAGVSAQPYFSARIGIRVPGPRVLCAPPAPVVVYNQPGYDQPVYDQPAYNQPVYDQSGCDQPVVYSNQGYNNTVVYENRRPVYYRENVYARPRYVAVNRYSDHRDNRGFHEDRYHNDHRDGGYRRW